MPIELQRIVLARRPTGNPVPEDFRLETARLPDLADGEIAVEVTHLSLDPYMRGRMDDVKSYAPSVALDGVMTGQGVGRVITSRAEGFAEGDRVTGMTGWVSHAVLPANEARRIDPELPAGAVLGVLGMPGFTGWVGLREVADLKAGETLVVGAATGPVGSMVGQIARLAGLRTVAVAGGAEKCRIARETFGFDAAIDHHCHADATALREALAEAAPDGVDVYWENVGGKLLGAVLPLMNVHGRIPLCGAVAWYGGADPDAAGPLRALWRTILVKRLRISGMIVFDHWDRYPEFLDEVGPRVAAGEIAWLEDVARGLENAPGAFISMLSGGNTGKQIVAL